MQEQFSYSLMASGLGILIVFMILVFLSILMLIIRKLFDDTAPKPSKQKAKSAAPKISQTAETAQPVASQLPLPVLVAAAAAELPSTTDAGFITAAVAAYFAYNDEDSSSVQAKCWTSSPGSYDPWVANNKLSKTVPGV